MCEIIARGKKFSKAEVLRTAKYMTNYLYGYKNICISPIQLLGRDGRKLKIKSCLTKVSDANY